MKTINKLFLIGAISLFMMSCSSDDDEIEPATLEPVNVFERLQGKTYKQVEKPGDCATCEDEINYYTFSKENMTVAGTDANGICEQYEITPIGDCDECAEVLQNNEDKLVVLPPGSPFNTLMTITFKSDTEVEFDYPVPILGATWTAQLYTDDVPCTDWVEGTTTTNPVYSGVFGGAAYENGTFLFPSGADSWGGFANEDTGLYPLSFPNGGKVTFNAATEGATDIVVKFVFERLPFDAEGNGAADTQPSFETATVTVSGTDTKEYSVDFASQGDNTFRSALLYLITKDQTLTASDFDITTN